ncbi:MAG: hypothetical protein FWF29_04390 [Treponema sp.]|nr:hypothetical protein [Treponema sp.]
MLSRDDFVFTIGYDGPVAVVDKQARRRYRSLSTTELAEKGLYRAACSSAIWSEKPEELNTVLEIYSKNANMNLNPDISPERLFGVIRVDVTRSIYL